MWFMRRMLRIPWTVKKRNEMVLKEAETNRSLVQKIRKQQATFFRPCSEKEWFGTFSHH